jgi:2-keto-4-pentenoate hydratase/2-oxohepta-3-ene-1,7-dioic acid hydratase in catechol pathway
VHDTGKEAAPRSPRNEEPEMTSYRLASYQAETGVRAGLLIDDVLYDAVAATGHSGDASMLGILEDWDEARERLTTAAARAGELVALDRTSHPLVAPLPRPGAIYCAGANYADHVAEMARARNVPPDPDPHTLGLKSWHFIKSTHAVTGPGAVVNLPALSKKVDWEAELVVVIGRTAKNLPQERAHECIAGYMLATDLSARDLGRRPQMPDTSPFAHDWIAHKSFDGSCPLGPWITPAEFAGDAQALPIQLLLNGEIKQDSNTADMIFNIAEQIAHISERITLHPGDLILTGTPAGVGNGRGEFLKAGDVVTVRMPGLGELTNQMA